MLDYHLDPRDPESYIVEAWDYWRPANRALEVYRIVETLDVTP